MKSYITVIIAVAIILTTGVVITIVLVFLYRHYKRRHTSRGLSSFDTETDPMIGDGTPSGSYIQEILDYSGSGGGTGESGYTREPF